MLRFLPSISDFQSDRGESLGQGQGQVHVILFLHMVFNSKSHYNHPVRKVIWIGASKLPFFNCLYQK